MPHRSALASTQPAESSPEPVVHVTIGRIEVRAAPATQPRRETQSILPALGLDEYLQKFENKR
jgi:hypothetical protein